MKKRKVLFLITKSNWGGAQRYVFDLATNIDKETFEPVIALGGQGRLYDELKNAGLRVISIRGLGRDISFLKDFIAMVHIVLILIKERPAVLHVNSSKVGALGTFFGRILLLPNVIFTSHGWAFNEDRPVWQKLIIKIIYWFTIVFSHSTIVVSNGLKKDFNWPFIQNKMQVIHLGRTVFDIKNRRDAREIISTKVRNNSISLYDHIDDFWIGTIAELHPTKCLHIAIEALAKLITDYPTLRYVIIHDGQEREQLEEIVKNLGLEEHVFFTGTIPEAAKLLSAFDLFILPSRSEAFGYVLIEAGQAGIPVIASKVGGIPEIVVDNQTGLLIEPCSADSAFEAMHTLIKDSVQRQKLAEALTIHSKKFSLEKMIEKTEKLYDSRISIPQESVNQGF